MPDERELLSQNELADRIGVSRQLIAYWRKSGRISPVFQVGQTIRYDYHEVLRQLEAVDKGGK